MWVRNHMGLWGANRLKKVFWNAGIVQPDSVSSIVLTTHERRLHGQPLELDQLLAEGQRAEIEWLRSR